MNAGTRLQSHWRWNGRPLRVRVEMFSGCWEISWYRWGRHKKWTVYRCYRGSPDLRETVARYRDYAESWRGLGDWPGWTNI